MSRLIEAKLEERAERERSALLVSVYGGLEAAVQQQGGVLLGISVKFRGSDTLMTIRIDLDGVRHVGFVGAADLAAVLAKSGREVKRGRVRWKEDKWRGNGG